MSDRAAGAGRTTARSRLRLPLMAVLIGSGLAAGHATGAGASDADLQRALLEAGCVKAETRPLPSRGRASIYQANCFGSAHRIIEVVCVENRCSASAASAGRDDDTRRP